MRINFYEIPIQERLEMADTIGKKLEGYLGTSGAIIFDNELEFLIHVLCDYEDNLHQLDQAAKEALDDER